MNTGGAHDLAYAGRAILAELLSELISNEVLTKNAVGSVLDRAIASLHSLGNLTTVPAAVAVVKDVRADLAKHGV